MFRGGGGCRGRGYNPWYSNQTNANKAQRSAPIFAVNVNDAVVIQNRDGECGIF